MYQLRGAKAYCFSSEAAALEYWKLVLTVGNEANWLGTGPVIEVSRLSCDYMLSLMSV